MPSVKRLMQEANPVRNDRVESEERAETRLAELLGSRPAEFERPPARRRTLVWGLAAAAVVVVGVGVAGAIVLRDPAPPAMSDQPFYRDTAELEENAEAIVRATVSATRTVTADGITETVATVSVGKVAKGDPKPGSSIEIAYSSTGPEQAEGIRKGGEYVLLLQSRDATTWNLVNTTQGYYTVAGGELTPTVDNTVALSAAVTSSLGVS
ncbi:hypothetical protein [Actinoplanes couchii]|uniref:Uncharacterized protein n=1 Tax=Actinoplanes couchii TaxID=403638 RepID=A0ABQ3X4X4_9ACTN|nr:hypothetical protein [Actinoplanes couchii]MDR6326070.1 hypothetical protein [Actinoplanes couchii]GID53577.1 hypothetical protein Aco03nite_019810 [Actinoplanes couchii]